MVGTEALMEERRLLVTRRSVDTEALAEYHRGWETLRLAATATGAHAWRFRSGSKDFIEFLEFRDQPDPRSSSEVARLLSVLDGISVGNTEEWVDATHPEHTDKT